jgi:glucose-6-phosphate dehydrogenase assembly protein OpcA
MSATVTPEKILGELEKLWASQGKEGQAEGGAGVLRACSMTLVVMTEEGDDAAALGETLAALMPEHPARAIVIRLRGAGERALTERVYQQCWMPFGQRRQICCEQIEITASDAALPDLPSVVLPLTMPDLPVMLWCRSARLAQMPEFRAIAAIATKVVVDSAGFADPVDALWRLADAARRGLLLGDLSWTRLTRWREMLSHVFENRDYLPRLAGVSSVRIVSGDESVVSAWYMGAWLVNALSDLGMNVKPNVVREAGHSLLRVELAGESFRAEVARQDGRLVVTVNAVSHCTSLPQPSDYLLMREELRIVRRDTVFERTVASAARLAYPTDK